ncbi:MAG: CRISPR-associated helicase Cas3' [Candidatus Bathyarchaeota archaeon]|nr:CRISPR-associated helicase Cas3' [Candidatus Bathyarchaeota archaeon]
MQLDCDSAYKEICGQEFIPFEHQREVWTQISENRPGFCLQSGTGSGKTEAVIVPALAFDKRLIMVYPTRSLVDDQIERAKRYIRKMLTAKRAIRRTLIVDVGGVEDAYKYRMFDEKSVRIILDQIRFWTSTKNFKEILVSENNTGESREYFDKNADIQTVERRLKELTSNRKGFELVFSVGPKITVDITDIEDGQFLVLKTRKHYYGGDVILTTLDKFIYRFFGYGERKWNLLYPYRFLLNPKKSIIAFDEAHVYDEVAYTNFVRLISSLIANPKITVALMSATLPNEFTDFFKSKFGFELVKGGDYKGEKTYEIHNIDPTARNEKILEIITQNFNKKTIVVRNTVANAFRIYSSLSQPSDDKERHNFKGVPVFFYHGRLFDFVKSSRYKELKKIDSAGEPYILITTHAIEVGCDLSSDIMVTDFCNPQQLIQRSGRCARKKGTYGVLHIIGSKLLEEETYLEEDLIDYQNFIEILSDNNGKSLPEEKMRNEIIKHRLAKDEITDALFRLMYSYVYNFDRTKETLHGSGILVTRSWEPSVSMVLLKKDADLKRIREIVSERRKNVEELLDFLLEQKWSYSVNPIKISLESLCKNEGMAKHNDLKNLQQETIVIGVDDSRTINEEKGYVEGNLNPYLNEIYVFYKPHEPLNRNPYGFGLVTLPKIFNLKSVGVKKRVLIKKQLMSDDYKNWTGDVKVDYIDLSAIS